MDYIAHYQALYNIARGALDAAGHEGVPLVHVASHDDALGRPISPPFIAYRQDVERPIGTTGGGAAKVLRSSWVFTPYTVNLALGLTLVSTILTPLMADGPALVTADGYTTTHFAIEGFQPLYEQESSLYASHLRLFWERSR